MKKKIFIIAILTISFFTGLGNVKAEFKLTDKEKCTVSYEKSDFLNGEVYSTECLENGVKKYFIYKMNGNGKLEKSPVFCLDQKASTIPESRLKKEVNALNYLSSFKPIWGYNNNQWIDVDKPLGEVKAKELLKKMAIYKWYFENNPENLTRLNNEQKYKYIKFAIWELLYENFNTQYPYCVRNGSSTNYYDKAVKSNDCALLEQTYLVYMNKVGNWYKAHVNEFGELKKADIWSPIDFTQPVIDLKIDRDAIKKYDYSLDIACTNCDSTNSDSKAFVIQDTTNWEAIFNSENAIKNSKCKGIDGNSYFKKHYGTYCREEYHVYFPNAYNRIKVQLGRFFTVNANSSEQHDSGYLIAADIPNFKPIKVKRVKECRGGDLKAYDNENKFENFKKNCIGKVYLKYNEDYYRLDKIELVRRKEPDSSHRKLENDILLEDVTYSYTLPNNTYQYIRMVDGKPVMKVPKDSTFKYINLGVGSLPVSFGNSENKDSNSVSVQLAYELPTKCNGSSIAEMYKTKTCFSEEAGTKNVYKKFIEGTVDNNDRIENSACAKLYNTTDRSNTEFMNCVRERQTSKSNKSFNFNDINKSNYLCKLSDDCNDEKDAKKQGRGWNSCIKKCCPLMYKFNEANCTCEPCDGDDCNNCSKETPNRSWNKVTNSCCPVGQIYNETTKKCENGNGDDGCTEYTPNRSWNEAAKKCCPVGKVYNVKTKKCEEPSRNCTPNETECNGVCVPKIGNYLCPDSTSSDFVYRVVSLEQPFIGQSGANRKTGSNWCNFDSKTGKTNCESDNPVVKAVITNNKNISEDKAMYKVTLDAKTIRAVRAYNKKNKYDDWDLKCLKNGKACISDFIHKTVKVTGKCSNVGKDSFYTCAK